MNDPMRPKDKPEPRRAEPIQPDALGSGREEESASECFSEKESLDRAVEQEQTALDNVRNP